jgi:hypothetical protein
LAVLHHFLAIRDLPVVTELLQLQEAPAAAVEEVPLELMAWETSVEMVELESLIQLLAQLLHTQAAAVEVGQQQLELVEAALVVMVQHLELRPLELQIQVQAVGAQTQEQQQQVAQAT